MESVSKGIWRVGRVCNVLVFLVLGVDRLLFHLGWVMTMGVSSSVVRVVQELVVAVAIAVAVVVAVFVLVVEVQDGNHCR